MNKLKLIALIFAAATSSLTLASDFATQLQAQGFSKQVLQRRGGITMDRINLPFYGVKTDQETLLVTAGLRRPNGISFSIDSKQYHYEAHENGEFGGELIAIDEQGQKLILIRENTRGFFWLGEQIYVLTSLAHMGMDQGSLYRLDEIDKKPRLLYVTALAGAAVDIAIANHRVYVLTRNDLEALQFNHGKVRREVLVHDAPWYNVPANLAMSGNQFAIGMRAGVVLAKYDNSKKHMNVEYFSK